jgi:hypothetical protein
MGLWEKKIHTGKFMSKVKFSLAEEELIEQLMDTFGIGRVEASAEMINYKRSQANYYEQIGNKEIAKMLRDEIGE